MNNHGPNGWGFKVVDYFAPSDFQYQNDRDGDIGSAGITLLPQSMGSTQHPNLLITGGKDYREYVLDTHNLTGYHTDHDYVVQELGGLINRVFSTITAFDGSVYFAADGNQLMQCSLANATLSGQPTGKSANWFGFPRSTPTISSNGDTNGILWALDRNYAFDTARYAKRL